MRKIQVPAYAPAEFGVQATEYSGMLCELVKTIIMLDMDDSIVVIIDVNFR
jgi:hypothetical protein